MRIIAALFALIAGLCWGLACSRATAEEPAATPSAGPAIVSPTRETPKTEPAKVDPQEKQQEIIKSLPNIVVDRKARTVAVDALICHPSHVLELFACSSGIREHEAILSVKAAPRDVNLALILLGLKAGNPVTWVRRGPNEDPETLPPAGPVMRVFVEYQKDGKPVRVEAHEWLAESATGKPAKPMKWVFAGGVVHNGHFGADYEGTVVCLSNFPTAVLDLPYESSDVDTEVLFKMREDVIPPAGTEVKLILQATDEVVKGKKLVWAFVINKDGKMTLDGEPSSIENLEAKLGKRDEYLKKVQILVHPEAQSGAMMKAMRLVTGVGLEVEVLPLVPLDAGKAEGGAEKAPAKVEGAAEKAPEPAAKVEGSPSRASEVPMRAADPAP